MLRRFVLCCSLAAFALAVSAVPALAVPKIDGEFPLAAGTTVDSNGKLVAGPDGNVWVAVQGNKDVAKVTPAGAITEYDLGIEEASGIAVGPEGLIWVAFKEGITKFSTADPTKDEPTAVPAIKTNYSIVTGPDKNLWVATVDNVIRINPANTADRKEFEVKGLAPKDIDVAGADLAVADFNERIVLVSPAGVTTDVKFKGGSQGVAGAPGGLVGFSQQAAAPEQVGLISGGVLQPLIETPGGGGDPFGAAFGGDGAFWFAMSANDGVARLTTTGQLTLLNGFKKESFPRQIAPGPGNTLWVTLDMTDAIGRVTGLEPPVPAQTPTTPPGTTRREPRTRLVGGPKGTLRTTKNFKPVQFGFTSPDTATSFECRIRKLMPKGRAKGKAGAAATKGKGKVKVPPFRKCASPKGYKLRPARYRFEVRAVNDGVVDRSPAQRTFRVVKITAPAKR